MAGGDAADDFAEEIFRKAESSLQSLLMRTGGSKGKPLHDRVMELLRQLQETWAARAGGKNAAEVEEEALADGLPVGGDEEIRDPALAYAPDTDSAAYFAEQLDIQELPFNLRFDQREAMWKFTVDADLLSQRSAEFQEYFAFHSLENTRSQLALEGACSQVGAENADIDVPSFSKGDPSNKKFGFRTVKWDPSGDIMRSFLAEAQIPFASEQINDELVAFEVNQAYAGQVEEIADVMCKNINGVHPGRFEFPEGFSAVEEVNAYKMTLDRDAARIVIGEFQAQGIEYTASQTGIDGQIEVVAQIHDKDALKRAYDNVATREVSVVPPEQAETMQKAYQAQNTGKRVSEQKKALEAQKNTSEKIAAERKRANPARDQREMSKSARQRATGAKTPKRTPNIGKGAK